MIDGSLKVEYLDPELWTHLGKSFGHYPGRGRSCTSEGWLPVCTGRFSAAGGQAPCVRVIPAARSSIFPSIWKEKN